MVVYSEKTAPFHRTTCNYAIPSQQLTATWTTRRALRALSEAMALLCLDTGELWRSRENKQLVLSISFQQLDLLWKH